jgi:uncharacterized membrane protein
MSKDSDVPVEVVLAAFNDEDGAEKALGQLKQAKKDRLIGIRNAAVLWKDDKGKLHFKETADMRGGKGAVIGGVIGGVVGLVFPPSILASAAVGAAVGGFSARLHDAGFPDDRLREVGKGLKPNTSALIAVIEDVWVREVEDELRQFGADVVTEAVRADIAAQLDADTVEVPVASGTATGATATGATATTATASDTSASSASTQSAATPGPSTSDTSTTAPASGGTPPPESTASGSDTGPNPA